MLPAAIVAAIPRADTVSSTFQFQNRSGRSRGAEVPGGARRVEVTPVMRLRVSSAPDAAHHLVADDDSEEKPPRIGIGQLCSGDGCREYGYPGVTRSRVVDVVVLDRVGGDGVGHCRVERSPRCAGCR